MRQEGKEDTHLWSRSGTHGNCWHEAWATLHHQAVSGAQYQVRSSSWVAGAGQGPSTDPSAPSCCPRASGTGTMAPWLWEMWPCGLGPAGPPSTAPLRTPPAASPPGTSGLARPTSRATPPWALELTTLQRQLRVPLGWTEGLREGRGWSGEGAGQHERGGVRVGRGSRLKLAPPPRALHDSGHEPTGPTRGHMVSLTSEEHRPLTQPACLTFWYHLSLRNPGEGCQQEGLSVHTSPYARPPGSPPRAPRGPCSPLLPWAGRLGQVPCRCTCRRRSGARC